MHRTHTCGELNHKNVGEEVILCGWAASRRDHGKITFIDLRDRYGITQVVFFPKPNAQAYDLVKKIRNEDVLKVKGVVNARPKGTQNPNISTGLVELGCHELEIMGACQDLPFSIDDSVEAGEEVRLYHRYLDLRRQRVSKNIILRHKFNQAFRGFLNKQNFIEVETPFLTKSTPEGARDYLVPSRLNPNKFYALPQSPQLFKQILMVGAIDRYYQIVRCFRDEDLRKDRQPEFTQLDIEMSFVEEDDILSLAENMICAVFEEVLGEAPKIPFKRITYLEAMEKYKTDKPDLGESAVIGGKEYRFLWVVDFPLFEYNEDEEKLQACHHPFTSPKEEDMVYFPSSDAEEELSKGRVKDLTKVRARAYDLVINGEEIGSGSIRIHSSRLQSKIFKVLGISGKEAQEKFGFLLRSFQYGAPAHGGIAFGLDRLYAIICSVESIRDVIAFPKTQKGLCPLTGAPANVSDKQLKELYIELVAE
ncbi:MAG: aspartate--tRNA ligase [Candidatus Omnitrophota bacterium]